MLLFLKVKRKYIEAKKICNGEKSVKILKKLGIQPYSSRILDFLQFVHFDTNHIYCQ